MVNPEAVFLLLLEEMSLALLVLRGLRPWKEMLDGESWWCFWIVEEDKVGVNTFEAAAAAMVLLSDEVWRR